MNDIIISFITTFASIVTSLFSIPCSTLNFSINPSLVTPTYSSTGLTPVHGHQLFFSVFFLVHVGLSSVLFCVLGGLGSASSTVNFSARITLFISRVLPSGEHNHEVECSRPCTDHIEQESPRSKHRQNTVSVMSG